MFTPDPGVWLFGYGSLIWRPDFAFVERVPGFVRGWSRRFWQGSPDHRGLPGMPGRVVTLVADAAASCFGVAYRLDPAVQSAALELLDQREREGYARHVMEFHATAGNAAASPEERSWPVLVYVASAENPHYLGPAPLASIVAQVRRAVGPSGANADYVLALEAALAELGVRDPHVSEIAEALGNRAATA